LAGLWIAYQLDVPPGAAIAALGGTVFAVAAVAQELRR
jgi:ABC-type Mn2+/Zn2+ transport system permease subunit